MVFFRSFEIRSNAHTHTHIRIQAAQCVLFVGQNVSASLRLKRLERKSYTNGVCTRKRGTIEQKEVAERTQFRLDVGFHCMPAPVVAGLVSLHPSPLSVRRCTGPSAMRFPLPKLLFVCGRGGDTSVSASLRTQTYYPHRNALSVLPTLVRTHGVAVFAYLSVHAFRVCARWRVHVYGWTVRARSYVGKCVLSARTHTTKPATKNQFSF